MTERFTLLVPTYNRPVQLGRLLRYLARQPVRFEVLVLDSSADPVKADNARAARAAGGGARVVGFDSSVPPFEKFWRGAQQVTTEFCALCADDDIVLGEAVPHLTAFLEARPDFVAAHGWYFNFTAEDGVAITSVAYRGPSVDAEDPLGRLRQLLERYEAVTYAVYRTEVLQAVLQEVQSVRSLFTRELLGAELTTVRGKVARRPLLYYGRSVGASGPHVHWHPVEFLVSSPKELAADYARLREIVLGLLSRTGATDRPAEEVQRLVDLLHLRYLSEYVSPRILAYLVDGLLRGVDSKELLRGYWPMLAAEGGGLWRRLRYSRVLRVARDRLAPGLRWADLWRWLGAPWVETVKGRTADGAPREYWVHREFAQAVRGLGGAGHRQVVEGLVRALGAYA